MTQFPESAANRTADDHHLRAGAFPEGDEFVRPDFMVHLGLLPPYTADDVHKAYKAKALKAHPDRGGSKEDFVKLQEVYEQAQEYVRFGEGRRHWLANQVEPYLRQQEIVQEVEARGGKVHVEKVEWMQRSFGDFATLAERLREIDLRDSDDGDAFLKFLGTHAQHLRFLNRLDLSGSGVTDAGLIPLRHLRGLQRLNLSRTKVSSTGLAVLKALPDLEWLNVGETAVGWFGRWQLARKYPQIEIASDSRA